MFQNENTLASEIELNHKIIGEGSPVVLLHGLFGMLDNLQLLAKGLSEEDYMVFLVDQRDHGRSPHTDHFDYPTLATDLKHFMDSQWLHQTILIGHSMGGKTALQFVHDYPGIVTKLVIIDIGIKKYPGGHEKIIEALKSVPLQKMTSRDDVFEWLNDKIDDKGTVHFLMKNLSRNKSDMGFEWKFNLSLLSAQYQNILKEIDITEALDTEVLFIRGEHSQYILDEDITILKKKFPNASFVTIANAGHWVHADNPKSLLDEINTFLKT